MYPQMEPCRHSCLVTGIQWAKVNVKEVPQRHTHIAIESTMLDIKIIQKLI